MFDGANYAYWKTKVRVFLQSIDYELWHIVDKDFRRPTMVLNDKRVLKEIKAWDESEKKVSFIKYLGYEPFI